MSLKNLSKKIKAIQEPKNSDAAPYARAKNPEKSRRLTDTKGQLEKISKASDISARLIEQIAEQFPPDVIIEKIESLLNAKHCTKGGQFITDNRAVEAGLKLYLSYVVGLPIQRSEIVNVNIDGLEAIDEALESSPALRRALLAKIQTIEEQNRIPDTVKSAINVTEGQ